MTRGEPPSRFQLQVKAWTVVATAATFAGLILYDWDKSTGYENIFSGIRPAIKSRVDKLYGVDRQRDTDQSSSTKH